MIELLVAVTIISITLLAVGALSSLSANGIALVQRKRAAENFALELTSKLKAEQKNNLPAGGAFAIDSFTGIPIRETDGGVSLNCSASYCDRIISTPSTTAGMSPTESAIGWDATIPTGSSQKFIRAWTISDEDTTRNWRRISVAVFSPDSTVPITDSVTGGVIK